MLKTMRKNVKSLKPVLWIVIATFIIAIFVVWGGGSRLGEKEVESGTLAVIGKTKISSTLYFETLKQRLQALQKQLPSLNKQFIQQLNLPQQVLEQMVQQALLAQAARNLGISSSKKEMYDKIASFPAFQKDGTFIGFKQYTQILAVNHIPLKDFEDSIRKEITLNKALQILTAGMAVTEQEVWENYRKQNESAKLEYILVDENKMNIPGKPDAARLLASFEKNKDRYKIPEKRSAWYVFFKIEDAKKEIKLTDADIEKYYRDNIAQFKELEKVKVSRIFLPYTAQDKDAVMGQLSAIHGRLAKGEDFAELAKKFSKDDKSKDGGDYGFFDWKSLPTKEQDEIKKLENGKFSGVVDSDTGASILRVTEKTPERTLPLDEVKPRIKNILEDEKARTLAGQKTAALEKSARKEKTLDAAAQKAGYKIQNTGLLKQGEAVPGIDQAGYISQALFALKEKDISTPIQTYEGVGLAQLEKIDQPRPAKFEEVKDEVEKDLTNSLKKDLAKEKAGEIRAKLTDKNWSDIADKNKLEFKSIADHKREQYIGVIGENDAVDKLAFDMPLKQTSEPVEYATGYALFQVLERKEVKREDFEKNKKTETETLLETKKNKFLQSWILKMREKTAIKVDYNRFLQVTDSLLSRFAEGN